MGRPFYGSVPGRGARGILGPVPIASRRLRPLGLLGCLCVCFCLCLAGACALGGVRAPSAYAVTSGSGGGGSAFSELTEGGQSSTETTTTATTAASTKSSSDSGTVLLLALIAAGVLLAGIAFMILRDAHSVAPVPDGQVGGMGRSGRDTAVMMRNRRAKAKAARRQRKRNR